jgi:hypothetical protein
MATQQQHSTDGRTSIADFDAITAAIRLYIEGVAQGDTAKLAEAFRPDARMYGAIGDQRFDVPATEFSKIVTAAPGDAGG